MSPRFPAMAHEQPRDWRRGWKRFAALLALVVLAVAGSIAWRWW